MPNNKWPRWRKATSKWWRGFDLETQWRRRGGLALLALALLLLLVFVFVRPRRQTFGEPWLEFSGEKALAHVQELVDFGPRPPESAAIKKTRSYIRNNWKILAGRSQPQNFSDETPRGTVSFVNLIARRPNESRRAKYFLLCSHYDTKTFDSIEFVGANDGGSSTGAAARDGARAAQHPDLAAKIELVFFDGEEAYDHFTDERWSLRQPLFCASGSRKTARAKVIGAEFSGT